MIPTAVNTTKIPIFHTTQAHTINTMTGIRNHTTAITSELHMYIYTVTSVESETNKKTTKRNGRDLSEHAHTKMVQLHTCKKIYIFNAG